MNVGLALEIDSSIDSLADVVTELEDALKKFFQERSYGSDISNLFIGIILTGPGSERLHPVRNLTFKKYVKHKVPKIELENVVEYDIKPNFEIFSQLTLPQARLYLARLLVDSIDNMKKNQKKFPNFDVEKFREDFASCLIEQAAD